MRTVSLHPLERKPELAPVLASWAFLEWSLPMNRNWVDTLARYDPAPSAALFPRTFVATLDGAPVGMASLRERDSHDFLSGAGPWICNVFVPAQMRGAGIARLLCEELIEEAGRMGHDGIFLASSLRVDSLYHRLGFRQVAEVDYFGQKYVLRLSQSEHPAMKKETRA